MIISRREFLALLGMGAVVLGAPSSAKALGSRPPPGGAAAAWRWRMVAPAASANLPAQHFASLVRREIDGHGQILLAFESLEPESAFFFFPSPPTPTTEVRVVVYEAAHPGDAVWSVEGSVKGELRPPHHRGVFPFSGSITDPFVVGLTRQGGSADDTAPGDVHVFGLGVEGQ